MKLVIVNMLLVEDMLCSIVFFEIYVSVSVVAL